MLLLLHRWDFVHFLYLWYFFCIFSPSSWTSNRHVCQRSQHMNIRHRTPEIGESTDTQIQPNNQVNKYAVCMWTSGKLVGQLKKGPTCRFAKTIFFFLIWAQMQSWGWWRFADSLQTKACWSSKVYRLIARWTYQTETNLN